ncbi:LuxR C-terminal-related transcriptional regulator [Slackia exigua]|uniref:response regulator transcription factor n=2 Tax=Slackia exigua TaxID=84109 RepID=UPI0028D78869|nr:LuxR C-terminal-related transcriptional regulator [Slackia exigua]
MTCLPLTVRATPLRSPAMPPSCPSRTLSISTEKVDISMNAVRMGRMGLPYEGRRRLMEESIGFVEQSDRLSAAFARAIGLTPREAEIFLLLARGRSMPRIAHELVLAEGTVKTHVRHIYQKADVSRRQELIDRYSAFLNEARQTH